MQRPPPAPPARPQSSRANPKRAKITKEDDAQLLSLQKLGARRQPQSPAQPDSNPANRFGAATANQQRQSTSVQWSGVADGRTGQEARPDLPVVGQTRQEAQPGLQTSQKPTGDLQTSHANADLAAGKADLLAQLAVLQQAYAVRVLQISGFMNYIIISQCLHNDMQSESQAAAGTTSIGTELDQGLSKAVQAASTAMRHMLECHMSVIAVDVQLRDGQQTLHVICFAYALNR